MNTHSRPKRTQDILIMVHYPLILLKIEMQSIDQYFVRSHTLGSMLQSVPLSEQEPNASQKMLTEVPQIG